MAERASNPGSSDGALDLPSWAHRGSGGANQSKKKSSSPHKNKKKKRAAANSGKKIGHSSSVPSIMQSADGRLTVDDATSRLDHHNLPARWFDQSKVRQERREARRPFKAPPLRAFPPHIARTQRRRHFGLGEAGNEPRAEILRFVDQEDGREDEEEQNISNNVENATATKTEEEAKVQGNVFQRSDKEPSAPSTALNYVIWLQTL